MRFGECARQVDKLLSDLEGKFDVMSQEILWVHTIAMTRSTGS